MINFNVKNALLTTSAICVIATWGNNARAEVIPDPSTIAPDVITLTPTTESEHSGNYIVLYDIDEGVNKYYDLTLNTTTYGTGTPSTQYTAKVPYEDVTITVNGESDERINVPDEADYGDIYDAFVYGKSSSSGGAIYSPDSSIIGNINDSIFISNITDLYGGGAIASRGTMAGISNSIFISNIDSGTQNYGGGAIYSWKTISIKDSSFIANSAGNGGAIYAQGGASVVNSAFIANSAGNGGAVHIGQSNGVTIIDSTFISNTASNHGGAIYNSPVGYDGYAFSIPISNIIAKNDNVIFVGNTANGNPNDIYNSGGSAPWQTTYSSTINLNTSAEKYIYLDGGIDGDATYLDYNIVNINKTIDDLPTAGTIYFNGDVKNQTVNMYNGTLKLGEKDDIFENVNMTVYGGLIDTLNGKAGRMNFNSFTVSGAIQMAVNVDLANAVMDYIKADTVDISSGTLNIASFLLLSDAVDDSTTVTFIESDDKTGLENVSYVATATYEDTTYDVTFDAEEGKFVFTKSTEPVGPSEEEVSATTATSAANGVTQALVEAVASQVLNRDVATMSGLNSGDAEKLSTWVELFGSNDDVELKNLSGAIDTQFYGVIGGVDSKKFTYDNGVSAVYGVYGAYTRSKQKYDGNKITQNGGYFGVSAAFRKDRVFNNVTLNGGFLANEADTKFGKDKFDTKVVFLANKTGVDLKKDEWTFTPALTLGYMGIDTDDYTAKSGVKVDNKFMNVFTVAPELKVAKDFGEGFSGYAKVAYKMFFYDNNKIEADDVLMPAMSVKPYVKYGIGLTKDWSQTEWNAHDVSSFAEIIRHDGGREGWDVNLGLKLDF